MIWWDCCLICNTCRTELYCRSGLIEARYGSDEHLAARRQVIADAFATYKPHSNGLNHHGGGELHYHDGGDGSEAAE